MGIVGSILVFILGIKLIKESSKILLDAQMDEPIVDEVIETIKMMEQNLEIEDLHIWRVGKGKYSCIISISSADELDINFIKETLHEHEELVHITIEINKK